MPNHVTNILEFRGNPEDIKRLMYEIKADEYGIGTIDFEKIIPKPKSLDIVCGSETTKAIELYLTSINPNVEYFGSEKMAIAKFNKLIEEITVEKMFYRYKYNLSEDEVLKIKKRCEEEKSNFDDIMNLGKTAVENFINYKATTWYDWCIDNWGTKWNAYDFCENLDEDNKIIFNTAWADVCKVIQKLSEKFPSVYITYRWADEDFGSNIGCVEFFDNKQIYSNIPEDCSKEAYEMASEILGIELEEEYIFNEKTGTYEFREDNEENQINL